MLFRSKRYRFIRIVVTFAIFLSILPAINQIASAQVPPGYFREVRTFSSIDYGILDPVQVLFSPDSNSFWMVKPASEISGGLSTYSGIEVNLQRDFTGYISFQANNFEVLNSSFNPKQKSLFYFDRNSEDLIKIQQQEFNNPDRKSVV